MGRIYADTGFRAGECATRACSESSAVNDRARIRSAQPPRYPDYVFDSVRDA